MKLAYIIKELELKVLSGEDNLDREATGGYVGDLLSDVMANSREGDVWITCQAHQNVVAVASLKEHAGIILVLGKEPEKTTIERARKEGIPIMVSNLNSFELVGRVYGLLDTSHS